MNDLIRSELRRFRWPSVGLAVAHILVLLVISRAFDVMQLPYGDQAMMLIVYMLLGLVLSVMQVGSYRQPSRWLWLIHRPLAPSRIFAAMALSALALLGATILVPLVVFLAGMDLLTTNVVDTRHYVTAVYALGFAMMAWLAGAHAATSRSRAAVAVLIAPVLLALNLASVWWLLLPVAVCILWLAYIARHSFRADRDAPINSHRVLLLTALPLQLAFFFLVFQVSKTGLGLAEMVTRGPGRTVLSTDTEVDVDAMIRNMSQSFIAKGLENSRDPRAASWREQLPLLELAGINPDVERFPVRHQLGNVSQPWWDDTRSIKWTFSHDRMMFHGRDLQSGASHGWWGTRGRDSADKFSDVPAVAATRNVLYAIDAQTQSQHELVRLDDGEWFTGTPVNALDRLLLLTNRRVLAYRPDRDALSSFAPPILDWELRLPAADPAPTVIVAELLDGWLVSFYYFDAREFDGFEMLTKPWQQIVHLDTDGTATVVGERRNVRGANVSFGSTASVPVASWWVSPPLYALAHAPDLLDTGLTQPPRLELLPPVPIFHVLTLALMLVSVGLGYRWLRATGASAARRQLWLVSCALIGLPALLSLICLEPRRRLCS